MMNLLRIIKLGIDKYNNLCYTTRRKAENKPHKTQEDNIMTTAAQYLTNDAKGIVSINVEKTLDAARAMYRKYSSPEALMASKFWGNLDARSEWAILTAYDAIAAELGRPRGGSPTLGDTIMAQQAQRVRQYGERAYRLSERQAAIVLKEFFAWFK